MRRTLLLSSIYEPINFIDDRKVISLLIRGVVEIVSTWEDDVLVRRWGDYDEKLYRPAVLQLTHNNTRPARIPTFRRTVVFARDGWQCQYCGKTVSQREATVDHIKPQSKGGPTTWRNCTTACKPCNRKKDNFTLDEVKMTLRSAPKAPTLAHLWGVKSNGVEWHESWDNFLPQ